MRVRDKILMCDLFFPLRACLTIYAVSAFTRSPLFLQDSVDQHFHRLSNLDHRSRAKKDKERHTWPAHLWNPVFIRLL